jgi:hypothetical protein
MGKDGNPNREKSYERFHQTACSMEPVLDLDVRDTRFLALKVFEVTLSRMQKPGDSLFTSFATDVSADGKDIVHKKFTLL